jgi:uncharacterized protein (DUF1501 family)
MSEFNLSRRSFLSTVGMGTIGAMLPQNVFAASQGLHHKPKAKRLIMLFMAGGQSQLDLFDHKPGLQKLAGQEMPPSILGNQRFTAMTQNQKKIVTPSKFNFKRYGSNGILMGENLPHLGSVMDDLCLVKSLYTESINHDPGKTLFCTGQELPGNPSLGSWLSYGLGSMNKDLPDFIVLPSAFWSGKANVQALFSRLWGSGCLPSKHQGTSFQSKGDPVLFLSNPDGVNSNIRREMLNTLGQLNQKHFNELRDPEIQTTMAQQEMAYRMQSSIPELTDITKESKANIDLYGPEVMKQGSYARNCLLARRMAERDVRCIQLFHRGWDHHGGLPKYLPGQCRDVDQPTAGLIKDLKQRGLLEDTLVVMVGEFGRTCYGQGKYDKNNYGRDHHPRCFSALLAGGGIQGGIEYGQTDEFSYNIVDKPVHVRDLHATLLWQLGLDHNQLSFPFQGLNIKLTGVNPAHVVQGILS